LESDKKKLNCGKFQNYLKLYNYINIMNDFTKMTELLFNIRTACVGLENEVKQLKEDNSRLRKERDQYQSMCCAHYEMLGDDQKSSYEKAVMDTATPWGDIVSDLKDQIQTDLEIGHNEHVQGLVDEVVAEKFKEIAEKEKETEPPVKPKFHGDWVVELDDALLNANITDGSKEACRKQWLKVAGEVRTWQLTPVFMEHINSVLEADSDLAESSRKTAYGQVASCFKHLRSAIQFPDNVENWSQWRRFNSKWEELKSKVGATTKHKSLSKEQLKQQLWVQCRGKCLTVEMLQEEVDKRLADNEASDDHRLKTMLLSFYAYHHHAASDRRIGMLC
jgi:hypothetical protein